MTVCTGCGAHQPCPATLLDGDGTHPRCTYCLLRLAFGVQRYGTEIVLMVRPRPAPVPASR